MGTEKEAFRKMATARNIGLGSRSLVSVRSRYEGEMVSPDALLMP